MMCRHCHAAPITRPRKLCWTCYYQPEIRDQYAPRTVNQPERLRRDVPLPDRATRALPGSRTKLKVLRRRARQRVQLFHPHDRWM